MVFSSFTTRWVSALAALLVLLATSVANAANVCDPTTGTQCASVNSNKAMEVTPGKSTRETYNAFITAQAVTASGALLSVESEASRGFRVLRVCVTGGSATAAAWTTWFLIRTTSASSAGTLITAETTSGAGGLAKMDPSGTNWAGVARGAGTGGTAGAQMDGGAVFVAIATTPPTVAGTECRTYCGFGGPGEQCPRVAAGTTNGIRIHFTGTAGGASQAASILFAAE